MGVLGWQAGYCMEYWDGRLDPVGILGWQAGYCGDIGMAGYVECSGSGDGGS